MKSPKLLLTLLIITLISLSAWQQAKATDRLGHFLDDNKITAPLKSFRAKRNPMPNLFIGVMAQSYMGRSDGFFAWSGEAHYNHNYFSLNLNSSYSMHIFPLDDAENPALSEYYTNFNISQAIGTFYVFSYKGKKKYRAFTGQVAYTPMATLIYYKKQSTKKESKLGVRVGFLHDQENVHEEIVLEMITPNDYTIMSYATNNLVFGISKSSFAYSRYGRNTYFHNGNVYFDMMFNTNSSENYKQYIKETGTYMYYKDLDLIKNRVGWRFGAERRATNSPIPSINHYLGFEVGSLPVPKYGSIAGFYMLLKVGVMFNVKVG